MGEQNDFTNQIKQAIENNDFSQVQNMMNTVIGTAVNSAGAIFSSGAESTQHYINTLKGHMERAKAARAKKDLAPMARTAPGGVLGPVLLILGIAAVICAGVLAAYTWAFYESLNSWFILPAALFILGLFLIIKGRGAMKYASLFKAYRGLFAGQPYASVQKLADGTGRSVKATIKTLTRLTEDRAYPQGFFSEDDKYYLLSKGAQDVLTEDLAIENARREQADKETALKRDYPKLAAASSEITKTIAAIDMMRSSSSALRKEQLRDELDKLQGLLLQINEYIVQNPQNIPSINGFLDYFLPTIKKLLTTYTELDREKLQTPNIITSKNEIESALQQINKAFENMYNDFFAGTAMDVYSDVSVLNTLIRQKGLADSDFNIQE